MLQRKDQSRTRVSRDVLSRCDAEHLQGPMHTRSSHSWDRSANHSPRRSGNARNRSRSPRREHIRTDRARERSRDSTRDGSHKRRTCERSLSPRQEGSKRRSTRESSRSPRRLLSREDETSLRHSAHRCPSHLLDRAVVVERQVVKRQVVERLVVKDDRRRESGRDRSGSPVQRRATELSHRTPQSRAFRHESRRQERESAELSETSREASGRRPAERHTESHTTHASMRVLHHDPHPSPPPPPAGLETAAEQSGEHDDKTVVAARAQVTQAQATHATSTAPPASQKAAATFNAGSNAASIAASSAPQNGASDGLSDAASDAASHAAPNAASATPTARSASTPAAASTAASASASASAASISREVVFGPITGENVFVKGEEETDSRRLEQRQRQIDLGKNTIGYDNYRKMVPKSKREHGHPRTPNIKWSSSKRGFDAAVAKWRRALHEWDDVRTPAQRVQKTQKDTGNAARTSRGGGAEVAPPLQCAAAQDSSVSSAQDLSVPSAGLSEPSTGVVGGSSFEALLGGVLGGDADFDDSDDAFDASDVDMPDAVDDSDDAEIGHRSAGPSTLHSTSLTTSPTTFLTTSSAAARADGSDCTGISPNGNQAKGAKKVHTPVCPSAARSNFSAIAAAAHAAEAAARFSDENARTALNDAVPSFSFGVSVAKAKSGVDRTADTPDAAETTDAANVANADGDADAAGSKCAVARRGLQARTGRPALPALDASIYLDCDIDSQLVG